MADPRFTESDLLPISALQHLLVCPRQCALIHLEQVWAENALTAEGRILHDKVHEPQAERRPGIRRATGLALRSLRLGLVGQADVVEFHRDPAGGWSPFPVEYKRGRPKAADCDRVQLCAQALCLEEMLGRAVPCGALFYGAPRRRQEVAFDDVLRRLTENTAAALHALIAAGRTPPPVRIPACRSCSLLPHCLPDRLGGRPSVAAWYRRLLDAPDTPEPPP